MEQDVIHVVLRIRRPDRDEMGVLNVGKRLELHDKRYFIESLFARCSDPFSGIELLVDLYLVATGLAGCNAWPPCNWLYRDYLPCIIVDVTPRFELMYKEVELLAIEFFVQSLRLAAEDIEIP